MDKFKINYVPIGHRNLHDTCQYVSNILKRYKILRIQKLICWSRACCQKVKDRVLDAIVSYLPRLTKTSFDIKEILS